MPNRWLPHRARALKRRLDLLIGDDVFISYSRADGATYAAGLASKLARLGLSCRFDQWESEPGQEVPESLLRALRKSGMLVIVGTARAGQSPAVEREITEFTATRRLIVPIDLDGSIVGSRWWGAVAGLAIVPEADGSGLARTTPTRAAIDRIKNSITFTRRNRRLQRAAIGTAVVVAMLLIASGIAAVMTERASRALVGAKQSLASSQQEFARQKGLTDAAVLKRIQADQEAEQAQKRAQEANAAAQAEELVLKGEASLVSDSSASLLIAIKAAELTEHASGNSRQRAMSLLRRAVIAAPRRIASDVDGVECFSIRPGGRSIVLGTQHSGALEYSLTDGRLLQKYRVTDWIDTVAWNRAGDLLAIGARDKSVTIWNPKDGSLRHAIPLDYQPQSVEWRKDGTQISVGLANGNSSRTRVLDTSTFGMIYEVEGMRAAWSPDGHVLATGGGDGSIHLFSASGDMIASLPGHSRYVHSVVWNPAGTSFATASVDDTVMVWDPSKPHLITKLANKFALSAAWSPDGRLLASGAGTSFVRVWDTRTYRSVFDLSHVKSLTGEDILRSGSSGYVLEAAWLPDGKKVVIADREGGILIYSARILTARGDDDWLAAAKEQSHGYSTSQ